MESQGCIESLHSQTWWHGDMSTWHHMTDSPSSDQEDTSVLSPWKCPPVSLVFSLCFINTPHSSALSIERSFNNWGQFFMKNSGWPARSWSIGVIGGFDLWGKYRVRESGGFTVINQTLISRQRKWREGGEPGAPALATALTGRRQRFYCSWQNIWSVTCEVSPFTHHYRMTSPGWFICWRGGS